MPTGEIGPSDLREQNHSRHWNRAVHNAIQAAEQEMEDGAEQWYTVELQLHITKQSPGWADGYKAVLTPAP